MCGQSTSIEFSVDYCFVLQFKPVLYKQQVLNFARFPFRLIFPLSGISELSGGSQQVRSVPSSGPFTQSLQVLVVTGSQRRF